MYGDTLSKLLIVVGWVRGLEGRTQVIRRERGLLINSSGTLQRDWAQSRAQWKKFWMSLFQCTNPLDFYRTSYRVFMYCLSVDPFNNLVK